MCVCVFVCQILEHTAEAHVDRGPLREALERAEELCSQVNEGVREKENSDRLEWIQSHIQSDGLIEVQHVPHTHTVDISQIECCYRLGFQRSFLSLFHFPSK